MNCEESGCVAIVTYEIATATGIVRRLCRGHGEQYMVLNAGWKARDVPPNEADDDS